MVNWDSEHFVAETVRLFARRSDAYMVFFREWLERMIHEWPEDPSRIVIRELLVRTNAEIARRANPTVVE
jgi:hypothetical protein